jgi:hypothetical protein
MLTPIAFPETIGQLEIDSSSDNEYEKRSFSLAIG